MRLVRLLEGHVAIDPTGKRAGRGAYLCAERSCWEAALKRKAIERALKVEQIDAADRQALVEYSQSLPVGTEQDKVEAVPVPTM